MTQTLGEYFLERLNKEQSEIARVYYLLFKLLGSDLDDNLKWASKECLAAEEDWFYSFHKVMRQADFFGGSREYYQVFTKDGQKEKESIAGTLDMILWNMIHVDRKSFLKGFMTDVFEDYRHFKNKKARA